MSGPSDEAYRAFAQTYLDEVGQGSRRPMSAASEIHGLSRASGNRWAAVCRQRGYLPGPPERATEGLEFLRQRIQERRELPPPQERCQLREACGISVSDLARSVGVTPAAVRQWERGEREPRGELLRRYLDALAILRESAP